MSRLVCPGVCAALVLAGSLGLSNAAQAQSTVVLDAPDSEVVDTYVRGGSYAAKNFDESPLVTRASSNATYTRRALLKFNTDRFIPKGASIKSATLTLTVRGGNSETRTLNAYRIAESFDEDAATWNDRKSGIDWRTAGGALGNKYATGAVTGTPGSTVSFNVTQLVQETAAGRYGSRYTRVAVLDAGSSTKESYREFYDSDSGNASTRPRLTIVFGPPSTISTTSSTPSSSASGSTIRVLHWNLHHGVGTDGRYDINRIASWIAKLNPDVVSLNEVEKNTYWGNENQPARYESLLESKTGRTWYAVWAQEYGNWSSNGKGNLLLSRLPLSTTARHELSYDRTIALGQVHVNGRAVAIMTTHLDPDSGSRRQTQADQLLAWAKNYSSMHIILGDMNAQPTSTEMNRIKQSHRDAWAEGKSQGVAHSAPDNPNGYTRHSRIDFGFAPTSATGLVLRRVEVVDTRDANGVMPSDHRPVLVVYEVR